MLRRQLMRLHHVCFLGCITADAVFIQLVWVWLDHVDEVGQRFLLFHRQRLKMLHDCVREPSLVHAGPRRHLVYLLVASQRIHLERVEVHLGIVGVGFVAVILRVLAPLLVAGRLNLCLVKVADVNVTCLARETNTNLQFYFITRLKLKHKHAHTHNHHTHSYTPSYSMPFIHQEEIFRVEPTLTVESMVSRSFFWATVFWMRLL